MSARWAQEVAIQVRAAWGGPHRAPWHHGLWVSALEDYRPAPLPTGFSVAERVLDGVCRRVAVSPGAGRTVVLVPGLYAGLNEGLFVAIAAALARVGRSVVLLEDRLAAGTVTLAGAPSHDVMAPGRQLAALCASMSRPPDVLAFSGGLMSAWAPRRLPAHSIVGFSGVRDPGATVRELRRRPWARWHFRRCHQRAGLSSHLSFDHLLDRVAMVPPLDPPDTPWLLVHAQDDPIVPVHSLDDLDPGRVCRLPDGGHLGFGVACGPQIYLAALQGGPDA